MLLVDKLNKGKLPEKPDKGDTVPLPDLSSLVVKPQNIAARIPNVDAIKRTIHERLIAALGQNSDTVSSDVIQRRIAELTDEYCDEAKLKLTKHDRAELAELVFENERELRKVIDRIVARIGRRVDESSPMVDARLPDGSRVNIVIPPLAVQGSSITIRKFSRVPYKVQDLVTFGTLNQDMASFIRACVRSRISMVVSGGTGSGKTTTLNVLSNFIPDTERVVTVEDTAELQLRQRNLVTLEARSANVEGRGAIAIRDLVVNALRMRPDRIVVGECRAGETLDMLQAMNTGHDGSMTTVHANSPKDAINRIETMVIMGGSDLPFQAIREQIVGGITLLAQQARLRDGRRVVTHISEITGINGNQIQLQDICLFDQTGIDEEGNVLGAFRWTGVVPKLLPRLKANGEDFPTEVFGQSGLQVIEGQTGRAGSDAAQGATAD